METKKYKKEGKHQCQCKKCRRKFIRELNYDEEFKRKTIQIFYIGHIGRIVGRIIKINKPTVYNLDKSIKQESKK